ncbi:MAG: type IV toxin-antitoxin system AbiEi family antitoxin [Bdellovibrionota bacterium]
MVGRKKDIIKIGSDAYHHAGLELTLDEQEFAPPCLLFGSDAYIGGATALYKNNLIDQPPHQIWVIVPTNVTNHNSKYRLIRTKADLQEGVEQHKWYRIASPERAIVDAFHFQTKLGGLEMAIRAARTALREKVITARDILQLAKKIGWEKDILRNWEAITVE